MNDLAEIVGHVFLCYAREDSRRVDELEGKLRAAGIRVWRDKADLWPGQDWRVHVRRAITEDALVFLACFSGQGLARRARFQNEELIWAGEQVRLRTSGDSWLIPVRFDDCPLPDLDLGGGRTLAAIQRADLFGRHKAEACERLVTGVLRILGPASVTPARSGVLAEPGLAAEGGPVDSARRNRNLPEKLPAVWLRLGKLRLAVDLARSLPDPQRRAGELAGIVLAALGGDSAAAVGPARAAARVLLLVLTGRDTEQEVLAALDAAGEEPPGLPSIAAGVLAEDGEPDLDILAVVAALAQVGLRDEAQELAADLDGPGNRARALAELAASLAADDPLRAARVLAQAESAVLMIDRSGYAPGVGGEKAKRARALADMAVALARNDQGHADRLATEAEATARDIADVVVGAETVAHVAQILAGTHPQRAARLAEDADRALSSAEMPQHSRRHLRVAVATALAATGQCDRARTIAGRIADADRRDDVLASIARGLARAGQPDQAMDVARNITFDYNRAYALTGIADALTDTHPEQAARLARDAATLARESASAMHAP